MLIGVHEYSYIEDEYGRVLKLTVMQIYSNGINPASPSFIGVLSIGHGFIMSALDDDFLNLSKTRTIIELKENDEEGFFNVVGRIKEVRNYHDWWYYCCPCGYPLQLSRGLLCCSECDRYIQNPVKKFSVALIVEDSTGKRIVESPLFPPIYEDLVENPLALDHIGHLGARMQISSIIIESIEFDHKMLSDAYVMSVSGDGGGLVLPHIDQTN
ncbi:hypothetical protein PIB30_075743 [Stylosanthes scabra]|uniref:Uncharacterized protein n=1 Tax=Stylosanthes scabra TaxID=79078 RepID=A0ABU6UPF4_9FABA|nr:hypothetical protein [Stylosanthes scabra]